MQKTLSSNEVGTAQTTATSDIMRDVFNTLIKSEVPLVFHNGLVDLIFMYASFYTDLPPTLSSFVADLAEMFPSCIFDTKYICEFKSRYNASFLEYVFRKT